MERSMFEQKHWLLLCIALLLLLLALAAPAGGRKGYLRRATPPAENTFSGAVEAVNQHTCENCNRVGLSVTLETGAGLLEVRLGPKAFFEEHDFYVSRGDPIQITGLRFMERGTDVVLANQVRKAGESLLLRGKYGKPAWIEARGYTCPVCGN
jgi:hypothetical protein